LQGHFGFYSSNINSAHFYPNNVTYGSWRIDGTRNGWHGIHFASGTTLMMNNNDGGIHREGDGWKIYFSGNTIHARAEVIAYWSDRRLKENIVQLATGTGLDIISKLKPSRFNWRKDLAEYEPRLKDSVVPGKEEIGLIAQEVQAIIPDAVAENKSGRSAGKGSNKESYLTVKYDRIAPFLIQAIQDLKAEIEELKKQLGNR
jgi:hypothetical protein